MCARKYDILTTFSDETTQTTRMSIPAIPGTYKVNAQIGENTLDCGNVVVDKTIKSYQMDAKLDNGSTISLGTIQTPSLVLEDMTWSEIAAISEAGLAEQYFSIGDTKSFWFGKATIIAFNHDDLYSGGKAGITFMAGGGTISRVDWNTMASLAGLSSMTRINKTNTCVGGWGASELHYNLDYIISRNITLLYNSAKFVNKTYYTWDSLDDYISNKYNPKTNIATSKFFLFSMGETSTGNPWDGEGTFYEYFNNHSLWGWSRSMVPTNMTGFAYYDSGTWKEMAASTSGNLSIGFCL